MSGDAGEYSAFTFLLGPNEWAGLAVDVRGGECLDVRWIANERPIGFVEEIDAFREALHDGMIAFFDLKFEGHVAIAGALRMSAEADAFGELFGIFVGNDGGMN